MNMDNNLGHYLISSSWIIISIQEAERFHLEEYFDKNGRRPKVDSLDRKERISIKLLLRGLNE